MPPRAAGAGAPAGPCTGGWSRPRAGRGGAAGPCAAFNALCRARRGQAAAAARRERSGAAGGSHGGGAGGGHARLLRGAGRGQPAAAAEARRDVLQRGGRLRQQDAGLRLARRPRPRDPLLRRPRPRRAAPGARPPGRAARRLPAGKGRLRRGQARSQRAGGDTARRPRPPRRYRRPGAVLAETPREGEREPRPVPARGASGKGAGAGQRPAERPLAGDGPRWGRAATSPSGDATSTCPRARRPLSAAAVPGQGGACPVPPPVPQGPPERPRSAPGPAPLPAPRARFVRGAGSAAPGGRGARARAGPCRQGHAQRQGLAEAGGARRGHVAPGQEERPPHHGEGLPGAARRGAGAGGTPGGCGPGARPAVVERVGARRPRGRTPGERCGGFVRSWGSGPGGRRCRSSRPSRAGAAGGVGGGQPPAPPLPLLAAARPRRFVCAGGGAAGVPPAGGQRLARPSPRPRGRPAAAPTFLWALGRKTCFGTAFSAERARRGGKHPPAVFPAPLPGLCSPRWPRPPPPPERQPRSPRDPGSRRPPAGRGWEGIPLAVPALRGGGRGKAPHRDAFFSARFAASRLSFLQNIPVAPGAAGAGAQPVPLQRERIWGVRG